MPTLNDCLQIRSVTLPNRLWFPPVARDLAEADGTVTAENIRVYEAIAGGGVGTVVVEHCFIHPDGRFSARQIGVDRDACTAGLARIASAIRAAGAAPILQASFAGSRTQAGRKCGPSAVPLPGEAIVAEALDPEYIRRIPALFGDAARRVREAGFCGVEVHCAHGFLLSQFLSPLTNRRADEYGGILGNRARLLLDVIAAVREQRREDFLVVVRLAGTDGIEGGLTTDEAAQAGRWLEEAGADILSVSGGLCGSRPASAAQQQGFFFPQARAIKAAVRIPVAGVGGIVEPAFARTAVADGAVDLVAVGRKLVEDPAWARRALESGAAEL